MKRIFEGDDIPPGEVVHFGLTKEGKRGYGIWDFVYDEESRETVFDKILELFLKEVKKAMYMNRAVSFYRINKMPGSCGTSDPLNQHGTVGIRGEW